MTTKSSNNKNNPQLDQILQNLLPALLASSLSVSSFISRWRILHSKLSHLTSLLHPLSDSPSHHHHHHPLVLHLLPNLASTLQDLLSLSSRCSSSSIPAGKLHLQSDLDIASSLLSLHLHDLQLLIDSGLLLTSHSRDAAAIVLPLPDPENSTRADILLFIRDAFARIQIGDLDMKKKALDSLKDLIDTNPSKISPLVADEGGGDVSALVRLLDSSANHSLIRDQAAAIVSVLCTGSEVSRRAVFEEGGLGPLLRLLETGSAIVKERAARAVEAITADRGNAWAVSAYGGVGVLIDACRSGGGGSPAVHALAAGALKNVVAVEDVRAAMIEEGALSVLIDLIDSGTDSAKKNALVCLWTIVSQGEERIKAAVFYDGGLQNLLELVRESSDSEILEHGLRAIQALSSYHPIARFLSSSREFFAQLSELIQIGKNVSIQQLSGSLISSISPNEEIKRSMASCMPSMIKMMELPKPANAQEIAAQALVCLLTIRSNRIELGRDAKSVMKLVQMLDPKKEEICKRFVIDVVLAMGASGGCRKRLNELGACEKLQRLVDADVGGAKRALKMLSGSKLKNLFSLSWRE